MPSSFRLNLQSVFRRLGMQSVRLPQIADDVQMTMQVTDLSRLIPAPIEPRGMGGINIAALAGNFGMVQLQALSPGGAFVEQLVLRSQAPGPADDFQLHVTNINLGLPLAININIGGQQILSRITGGWEPAPFIGAVLPAPATAQSMTLPVGIFVPNQMFFSVRAHTVNARLDVMMIYRELPSVEDVG